MNLEKTLLAKIFLVIFSVILVTLFYKGIITIPNEGDSVDYHIPIAQSIISGEFLNPINLEVPTHTRFYPANGELVIAAFIFLGIPLGLYNVLGVLFLFIVSLRFARSFNLDSNLSIIFAVTVATLNGILRWADTQIVDIYLLSFFLLTISLLEKPRKSLKYFVLLGTSLGFLIGVKFSGPFLAAILFLVYFKNLVKFKNFRNFLAFIIPIMAIGFSWYIRNITLVANPFFPQAFLFFPGQKSTIIDVNVLKIATGSFKGFVGTLNGFVSEFIAWAIIAPSIALFAVYKRFKNENHFPIRLLVVSSLVFLIVINLPSSSETHIQTSSFRYFHPAISPLILTAFLYFKKIKKIEYLIMVSLSGILLVEFPFGYFPKLIFFAGPIAVLVFIKGYDLLISRIEKF